MSAIAKAIPGVMSKFRISELSGVNSPAQAGARAVFMKRADDIDRADLAVPCPIIKRDFSDKQRKTLAESGAALPDGSYPIESVEDLKNAIRAFGRAKDKAQAKAHIISRAKALGSSDLIPDSWATKAGDGANPGEGDTMSPEMKKALGLPDTATDAQVTAAVIKLAGEEGRVSAMALAKAEGERDRAVRKASMSDKEKAHTADMSDDDADDFMKKPKDARDAMMAKALEGDETLTSNGVSIRKSQVGPGAFAFMKAQAEALTQSQALITKANEERATEFYKSRVATEFAHVAGTVDDRVALLKSIDSMPEAARPGQLSILKAAEATAKLAFTTFGKSSGVVDSAGEDPKAAALAKLDTSAKEVAKAKNISFAKAYQEVLEANPELYEAGRPNGALQ